MQPAERKRQGYIHELIETEERYVDDLQLVVEVRGRGAAGGASGAQSQVPPLTRESQAWQALSPPPLRMLPLPLGEAPRSQVSSSSRIR